MTFKEFVGSKESCGCSAEQIWDAAIDAATKVVLDAASLQKGSDAELDLIDALAKLKTEQ